MLYSEDGFYATLTTQADIIEPANCESRVKHAIHNITRPGSLNNVFVTLISNNGITVYGRPMILSSSLYTYGSSCKQEINPVYKHTATEPL
jgi:hypothetical protein